MTTPPKPTTAEPEAEIERSREFTPSRLDVAAPPGFFLITHETYSLRSDPEQDAWRAQPLVGWTLRRTTYQDGVPGDSPVRRWDDPAMDPVTIDEHGCLVFAIQAHTDDTTYSPKDDPGIFTTMVHEVIGPVTLEEAWIEARKARDRWLGPVRKRRMEADAKIRKVRSEVDRANGTPRRVQD